MTTRRAGQVPWALVLVALAAVAASGQGLAWAQAARNETAASANGETLDALLSTTSRAFSKSRCIESIRLMKHTWSEFGFPNYPEIPISFPADRTLIPPGAKEWCDCLRDKEPDGGIPSDYEGVFNTCRDQVLVGSDFNAMDICRGMVKMYGSSFWYNDRTFCSRNLCEGTEIHEYGPPRRDYQPNAGNPYERDAFDLSGTCGGECMKELSAGYCAKYRLTYGGWVLEGDYRLPLKFRHFAVDGTYKGKQHDYLRFSGRSDAKRVCDALYPTDQERCCTYARGYYLLKPCCFRNAAGVVKFNCANAYGGDSLRHNCLDRGNSSRSRYTETSLYRACEILIDYYVQHPTYQQATLAKLPNRKTAVVFPEAFMNDFCNSDEFYYTYRRGVSYSADCCVKIREFFNDFVENCLPGAGSYKSLGAARLPPKSLTPTPVPTPSPTPVTCDACSFVFGGECESVCKRTEECAVRNGKAFCVRCDYFRQDFPDGNNHQCCELREDDSGTFCKSKINDRGEKNKCFTDEGPWTTNKGVKRTRQPYTIDAVQNVCNSRKNFWVNRMMCRVKTQHDGRKFCKYITDEKRDKILAGR